MACPVQEFAFLPCDIRIGSFQILASLLDAASARGGEGDDGLSFEVVCLHEGIDDRRTGVPPNGETDIDDIIFLQVLQFVSDGRARCLVLHFCEWLAEHVGVGAVPGSCFFREDVHHLIRFHFAKRDETLNAALNRLSELDIKAKHYQP